MDLTVCKPGNGSSGRFWKDKWRDITPKTDFPHLFSFAKQQDISLDQILQINASNLLDRFHLPLSMIAFQQNETMAILIQSHRGLRIDGSLPIIQDSR